MRSIQSLVVPFVLAIFVTATYGQESETKDDNTKNAKAAKMLHGVWAGDADKTAEVLKKMDDMEEGKIEMVLERVTSFEIEFQDGTFNVAIGDRDMDGKWKVTSAEKKDDQLVINIHVEPTEDSAKKFEIQLMGEKSMKMIDLDQESPPFVMTRKTVRSNDQ